MFFKHIVSFFSGFHVLYRHWPCPLSSSLWCLPSSHYAISYSCWHLPWQCLVLPWASSTPYLTYSWSRSTRKIQLYSYRWALKSVLIWFLHVSNLSVEQKKYSKEPKNTHWLALCGHQPQTFLKILFVLHRRKSYTGFHERKNNDRIVIFGRTLKRKQHFLLNIKDVYFPWDSYKMCLEDLGVIATVLFLKNIYSKCKVHYF